MQKIVAFALLLCLANTAISIVPNEVWSWSIATGMTVLDYYTDISRDFYALMGDSTGFQLVVRRSTNMQTVITASIITCFVDLVNLDNPYNPHFAGNYALQFLYILYKPNIAILGGARLVIAYNMVTPLISPQIMPYFHRAKGFGDSSSPNITYYYIDELGNQYSYYFKIPTLTTTSQYNITPVTGTTYAGFSTIRMYTVGTAVLITDNFKQKITVITTTSSGGFLRQEQYFTSSILGANFVLSQQSVVISFANNTVVVADLNPFTIRYSYSITLPFQRFVFYDSLRNHIRFVTDQNQVSCMYFFHMFTEKLSTVGCYQNPSMAVYAGNSSYFVVQNLVTVNWFELYDCQFTLSRNNIYNLCTVCSSTCKWCKTYNYCMSCWPGFDLDPVVNHCCPTGQKASITALGDKICNPGSALSINATDLTFVEEIQGLFESAVEAVNKVPSVRSILLFIFSSMMNFDDMYLYYYHEREYGNTTRAFLQKIRKLQNDKWQAMSTFLADYFDSIALAQQYIQNNLDYYLDYSSKRFVAIQGNGQGLILNSWNFITTNFLISAFIFVTFAILFRLTFNFKVSKLFRPYSFALYFVYFILEGNTQTLVFYASSSFRLSFSSNMANKLLLSVNYIFGFFFVLFCICGYILLFKSLKKFLKYFLQNITLFQQMILYLTLTLGLKNLLFGFVHSEFRGLQQMKTQFCLLLVIEFCCMGCYIAFLKKDGFEFKIKVWIVFVMQVTRILFIFLLFLQQSNQQSSQILQLCQVFLSPLLKLYTKMTYVSIFVNFLLIFNLNIIEIITLLRKHIIKKKTVTVPVPVCSTKEDNLKQVVEMIRVEYINSFPSKTEHKSKIEQKRESAKAKSQFKPINRIQVNPRKLLFLKNEGKAEKHVIFQQQQQQ